MENFDFTSMKLIITLMGLVLLFLVASGCTQPAPSQPIVTTIVPVTVLETLVVYTTPEELTTTSVSDNTVNIRENTFIPVNITVSAGSIVRWVNGDDSPHRIQFADNHYATVLIGSSQSASQRFDRAGVFAYSDLIHPEMHGTVTVV